QRTGAALPVLAPGQDGPRPALPGRPDPARPAPLSPGGQMTSDSGIQSGATVSRASQPVTTPLTGAAIFMIMTVPPGEDNDAAVGELCGDLAGLLRSVGFRDLEAGLTCVMGFSSAIWDRVGGPERPAGLHPFKEIHADGRHAPATPGDLLFHIRATRMD